VYHPSHGKQQTKQYWHIKHKHSSAITNYSMWISHMGPTAGSTWCFLLQSQYM